MNAELIVIGGGPAGMTAAIAAARAGQKTLLLEQNAKLGRKLAITGKGRCNLTNDCTVSEALAQIPQGARFLHSAMNGFPPEAVKQYFTELGVPLKTERGGRVFPRSDKAYDVVDALLRALRRAGVSIAQERAGELLTRGAVTGVRTDRGEISCKAVVLATGGLSYPLTGSTGDGYRMASELGHTIAPARASLVPLEAEGGDCAAMQGLALKNVAVRARNGKDKTVFEGQGELLFTHFGLSGPLVLSASAHMRDFSRERYHILIDLKPGLTGEKLDARLLRDFAETANRDISNALGGLLPRLIIPAVIARAGIAPDCKVHSVTRGARQSLLSVLKAFRVDIAGPRPVAEAIVTSGGVKTEETDPKTMMSKKIPGLFFAGELLDADGYTGGFNLQIAWCTGRAAGLGAARYLAELRAADGAPG